MTIISLAEVKVLALGLWNHLHVTLEFVVNENPSSLLAFKSAWQYKTLVGGGDVTGLVTVIVVVALPEQDPVVPVTV